MTPEDMQRLLWLLTGTGPDQNYVTTWEELILPPTN